MIKPYYDHKGITIYHGDCLEILPQLDKVDLVLTDPPYGVGLNYSKDFNDNKEYLDSIKGFIFNLPKLSKLTMITCGIRNLYDYPKPDWIFCWHKPAAVGRNDLGGFNNWEPILVYGKKRIYQDYYYAPSGNEK